MKTLFLGIDALDSLLLERYIADMPNFQRLRAMASQLRVKSTFPPDSDTAWTTIFTGLRPAEHGIVQFVDPLEKTYRILHVGQPNEVMRGRTLWDQLQGQGFKTYVLFPHLCYPVWETGGGFVARGVHEAGIQASPADLLARYPRPELQAGIRGFPRRSPSQMLDYFERMKTLAQADADFALELMADKPWDFMFVYWSTLDAIGHFFWNYQDPDYPGYQAGHALEGILREGYLFFDSLLGRFLDAIDEQTALVVLSDHGHGRRPIELVNINEVLRRAGYLNTFEKRTSKLKYARDGLMRLGVRWVSRLGLGQLASRFLKLFPTNVETLTRPQIIDWENTVAFATDMSGVKAYAYGGIRINRQDLTDVEYEQLRDDIIERVQEVCQLPDGTNLVKRICRREAQDQGEYLEKYPDILIDLIYGHGIGWGVDCDLFTQAESANLVPGSHRGETGVCFIRSDLPIEEDEIDLVDVYPTLLDQMGVAMDPDLQARSLFRRTV